MKRIKWDVVLTIITNKELEQVGIEPDMESRSGEEISNMFQQEFRSVYKELHADHETGAADNK